MFSAPPSHLLIAGVIACVAGLATQAHGESVIPNTLDTDSYVFVGTNNSFSPEVSVGVDLSPTDVYHFNFGVLAFDDLSALSATGGKHLRFEIEAFSTTEIVEGFPVTTLTTDGEATFKVVELQESYNDYLASSDKPGWFDTYVGTQPAVATGSFSGIGVYDLDVTGTVNRWIAGTAPNHGLALVLTAGDPVELGANEGGNGAVLTDTALTTPLPGDTDGDGDIDDTDLGLAIANFTGPGGSGKTAAQGDTDADGDVDDTDLGVAIAGFTGPGAPAAAVPEPGAGLLLAFSALGMMRRRRN